MTVIAWDGATLAADSLMGDGCNNTHCKKIYQLKNGGLYGGAGDGGYADLVGEWLDRGMPEKGRPDYSKFAEASFAGLVIDRKGGVFALDPYLALIPIFAKHYAVGSGAPHAMTLMAIGYTAERAVKTIIDKQLANGVGGEVQTLQLQRRRKGIRK